MGRNAAIGEVKAALRAARSGDPALVMVRGVSGIGKTRLVHDVLAAEDEMTFEVCATHGLSARTDLALGTASRLVTALTDNLDDRLRSEVLAGLEPLAVLEPGLGLEVPAPLADPRLEHTRIVNAVVRLITRRADLSPLALVIDDAHNADPTLFEVLAQLIRTGGNRRLLVVLTIQSDASVSEPAHPLRLLDLQRPQPWSPPVTAWQVMRVELGAFDASDVEKMVVGMLRGPVAPDLLTHLRRSSGGIPGFLESLVRAGVARGEISSVDGRFTIATDGLPEVPDDILAVIRRRFEPLGEAARSIMQVLAVDELGLSIAQLMEATELGRPRVLDALDELIRARLVVTGDDHVGHFGLVDDLVRQGIRSQMHDLGMARVHLALADVLTDSGEDIGRVANHLLGAGALSEPSRVLEVGSSAGREALRVGASERARVLLKAAVRCARSLGVDEDLPQLLVDLGRAQARCGDLDGARHSWHDALEVIGVDERPTDVCDIQCRLAALEWEAGNFDASLHAIGAGHAALEGLEPTASLVELLHCELTIRVHQNDRDGVSAIHHRLESLTDRFAAPDLRARCHLAASAEAFASGDPLDARRRSEEAYVEASVGADPLLTQRAMNVRASMSSFVGETDTMWAQCTDALDHARRMGVAHLELWPLTRCAGAAIVRGDWDDAEALAAECAQLAWQLDSPRGRVCAVSCQAWLLAWRGRLREARELLDELSDAGARPSPRDPTITSQLAVTEALVALEEERPALALEALERGGGTSFGFAAFHLLAIEGRALAAAGDLGEARRVAAELRVRSGGRFAFTDALVDWLDGEILRADNRSGEAAESFRRARKVLDERGCVVDAARLDLMIASSLKRGDEAVRHASKALVAFERLDAARWSAQARTLLRGLGVVPARGRPRSPGGSVLTPRQLEVARLAAAGLSNKEISERLFISVRTVTTHLHTIYSKLDVRSRAALTRYLADRHLLGD